MSAAKLNRRKENEFQHKFITRLKETFPGCIVLKNDPTYIQGFPDLTLFYKTHWAVFECKADITAPHQSNQDYYIDILDGMSYANFVYPENMEAVLYDVQCAFGTCG